MSTITREVKHDWSRRTDAVDPEFGQVGQPTTTQPELVTFRKMYGPGGTGEGQWTLAGPEGSLVKGQVATVSKKDGSTVQALVTGTVYVDGGRCYTHDFRQVKQGAEPEVQVPAGYYATTSRTGHNDLDFWQVDVPTQGKWTGYTFVSRVIGGREDQRVRGAEAKLALAAIAAAGPEAAAQLYGQSIGRCGRCNRHLTDETSRQLGLGPDCAQKGW